MNSFIPSWKNNIPSSPAVIIDQVGVTANLEKLSQLTQASGCKLLYSIKSLPLTEVLRWCLPYVDGFSVSSLFEARLAHELLQGQGSLHVTTPGLNPIEFEEIRSHCQYISFNSLSQYERLKHKLDSTNSPGLRINPQLSFVPDHRYDPCRPHSKLGVNLDQLTEINMPEAIQGVHFHTVFATDSFKPLLRTLDNLQSRLGTRLKQLHWLNFGGGYLYNAIDGKKDFIHLVKQLREELNVEIFIEPGNALVNDAGYLLATVVDSFQSEGKQLAVLDSSVNHNPEIFEYQIQAEVCEHTPEGEYPVTLAGCTCLAGDLFGEYRFSQPLKPGDTVLFKQVGAYSLVKAHRFNGYNLPDIYGIEHDKLKLLKRYSYKEYRQQWYVG